MTNQPPAKWTQTEFVGKILKFTNGKEFISIPNDLVEQLKQLNRIYFETRKVDKLVVGVVKSEN